MINQIDFRKLLPYDGSAWQSFEMLCYVIAKRLYPNGNFTPINGKGGDDVKAFFEEYGLVLVVTVIATGMILFSENFKATMQTTIESQWQKMTEQY